MFHQVTRLFIFFVVFQFHVVQTEFLVMFERSLVIRYLHFWISFWGVDILQVAIASGVIEDNTTSKCLSTYYVIQFFVELLHFL